jgi:hypothetical protein
MGRRKTKKEAIKEIIKCAQDPIYFLRTYGIIYDEIKGYIPFDLFSYQEDIIKAILEHRFNICLKARQLGITTVIAGFCAWLMYFHKGKNCIVLCTKQETAKNTLRTTKRIIKNLPKWMTLCKIDIDNITSIELSNESRLKAITTSEDAGRSEAASFVFIDECAFVERMNEIWVGMKPTLTAGGRVFLGSTPSGVGSFFHSTYVKAQNNENNFNCRFGTYINPEDPDEQYNDRLMWWTDPRKNKEWFEKEIFGDDPRTISQERLCSFNEAGYTFVAPEQIEKISTIIKEPDGNFDLDRNVWIWEPPDKAGSYIISVDVSRGDSGDYSAFPVFKLNSYPIKVVAEYKGKIKPDQLGHLLYEVGRYYNHAMIAPENNAGWAGQTIQKLQELKYPQIYFSRRRRPKTKDIVSPDPFYASMRNEYLPGYSVTSANRNHMLAKLEQALRMGDLETYSYRFLEEIKTFIVTANNRPEAMRGYNDDLIMAYAGGLWVRDEAFVWSYRSDEMTVSMLEGISYSDINTKDIKQFNHNSNIYDRARIVEHQENVNKIKMGDGREEDLGWLITSG